MASRDPAFHFSKNQLTCDGVRLAEISKRHGTPLYCYSAHELRERYREFAKAFAAVSHTVCYSVKANSNLSLLKLLAKQGAGFDVVSGGELLRVEKASRSALRKVVFSGVGKSSDEIEAALARKILLFNIESEQELETVEGLARRGRTTAHIAFRVNPDVSANTHPYISTGLHEHKFGVPIEEAEALYQRSSRSKFLNPTGVSVHIGSQINDFSAFREAMSRVADLIDRLRVKGIDIRTVDAGGGLGIDYQQTETASQFAERAQAYARAVVEPLKHLKIHLILEPGRALIAPTGILLTRVLYTKRNGNKRFAIVDAAMNDLIRPALYQAFHRIVAIEDRLDSILRYDIVGPVCESGDFLGHDRAFPELMPGNLLAVFDAGAYGMSLASNYNSRPRPAEVLIDGKKTRLIRRRETIKDMLKNEA